MAAPPERRHAGQATRQCPPHLLRSPPTPTRPTALVETATTKAAWRGRLLAATVLLPLPLPPPPPPLPSLTDHPRRIPGPPPLSAWRAARRARGPHKEDAELTASLTTFLRRLAQKCLHLKPASNPSLSIRWALGYFTFSYQTPNNRQNLNPG